MSDNRDWKDDVECCEDPKGLYDLGLEMAEEIERLKVLLDAREIYEGSPREKFTS